jgi:hypothetical protein
VGDCVLLCGIDADLNHGYLTLFFGFRDALRTECKEAVERARKAESMVESIRSERDAALGNAQAAAEHSKAAHREREEIVQRAVATSCERDAALEVNVYSTSGRDETNGFTMIA